MRPASMRANTGASNSEYRVPPAALYNPEITENSTESILPILTTSYSDFYGNGPVFLIFGGLAMKTLVFGLVLLSATAAEAQWSPRGGLTTIAADGSITRNYGLGTPTYTVPGRLYYPGYYGGDVPSYGVYPLPSYGYSNSFEIRQQTQALRDIEYQLWRSNLRARQRAYGVR